MDGSSLGNPGPCRAAAVCFPEGLISEPVVCDLSESKCSTSYHGELCAIRLATAFSVCYSHTHLITQIHNFSDCKSAIASSASLDLHICHQNVVDNIQHCSSAQWQGGLYKCSLGSRSCQLGQERTRRQSS